MIWLALAAAVAVVVTGCGTGDGRSVGAPVLEDGGWIDGAPPPTDSGWSEDMPMAAEGRAADSSTGEATAGARTEGAESEVVPPGDLPDGTALRAGNVDDNADFAGFLEYLRRVDEIAIPRRVLDPAGRVVITVEGEDGSPVAGAEVVVHDGDREVARLRTTADGTARFHPAAYEVSGSSFSVSTGASRRDVEAGGSATLVADAPEAPAEVPLDIAFAIDTTGSMGDELDRLKQSVTSVVDRIEELPGSPDVRLAMTVYRDEGDAYVTATHDFTGNIAEFRTALEGLEAGGGGDQPEALDEAVGEVLAVPAWRDPGEATQLLFVVGDAGGHPERQVDHPYTESMTDAAERGLKIIPIAASSTDDQAEVAFRQMAQFTGGRFVFLAYGAGGAAVGGSTDISSTDYEELSLDDLIVRLVADELAARTGTPTTVPTTAPTTVPPTNPPGQ